MRSSLQKEIDEWLGNVDDVKDLPYTTPMGKIVDSMIAESHTRRLSMSPRLIESYSAVSFAIEFCTIRCDFGRRTGKSSYIKDNADGDSLVIAPNQNQGYVHMDKPYAVISPKQLMNGRGNYLKKYSKIYIDEPSRVFKVMGRDELYNHLVDWNGLVRHQTFILLGE